MRLEKKVLPILLAAGLTLTAISAACAPQAGPSPQAPAASATEPLFRPSATPEEPTQVVVEPSEEPTSVPGPGPIVLVDGLGREVSLPGPAQAILSLAPSNTEILFAIGAGDQMVGREDFSDYPPEALDLPSIGSTFTELNAEAVVALEPDLVLAAEINPPEQVDAIEKLGIKVFYLANPLDFEGLYANLMTVGKLTGREPQAQALVGSLSARVDKVVKAISGAEPVSVYYEVDGTDPTAPWTTGSGTFQDYIIALAGGENIAADLDYWAQISTEEIIGRNPQVIIFEAGGWVPTTVESIAQRAGWADIDAVRESRIYAIDTNLTGRPGPRYVDGLEALAEALHPDLFEQ